MRNYYIYPIIHVTLLVHMYKTTICSHTHRWYVSDKNKWIIQGTPKCICYCWCLFIVECDDDPNPDTTLCQALQRGNLKLNKEKCIFRYTHVPFFGEIIPRLDANQDFCKLSTNRNATDKTKEELQSFLWIMIYLRKFSPATMEEWKLLCKLNQSRQKEHEASPTNTYSKKQNH